ncbi:MAG: hypothetical protein ACI8T1_000752 [Verrucomicrobiales bacterium]|jgi:hypothetical protein
MKVKRHRRGGEKQRVLIGGFGRAARIDGGTLLS